MDLYSLTHLLLSISLFSFIISYSTSYSCLIHSFKLYLTTLISHILDKNCIFLIFNGILVFLAKTSGSISISNAIKEQNESLAIRNRADEENQDLNLVLEDEQKGDELEYEEERDLKLVSEDKQMGDELEYEEKRNLKLVLEDKQMGDELEYEEKRDLKLVLEDKQIGDELECEEKRDEYNVQEVEDHELDLVTVDNQEEEKETEDDNVFLSSEDLNKKFDDFIRRMKEEFRRGAQEQLAVV